MPTPADVSFLRTTTVFKDLSEAHLTALLSRLRERRLRKGDVLFRAGDQGHELFVIRDGTIVVSKPVIGRVEQVLARLGPGQIVGEMSLFDEAPRSATLQAETDAWLLCLDRGGLNQFIELSPEAAAAFFFQVVKVFVGRLRDSGNLIAEVTRWGLEATGMDLDTRGSG